MRNIALYTFCFCVLLSGCGNRNKSIFNDNSNQLANNDSVDSIENDYDDSNMVYFLDFEQNVKNMPADTFTINSIAKDITFIPLETTDEALLQVFMFKIAIINERYYISSGDYRYSNFSGILEFDSTGRFLDYLMLETFGNGPEELPPRVLNWTSNPYAKLLFASSSRQILLHSFNDSCTNKYNLDSSSYDECLLNDGTIVSLPNPLGFGGNPAMPYLHFRNQKGKILHSVYYSQKRNIEFKIADGGVPISIYGLYPQYNGNALFQDILNDTLYCIRSMYDINPYIIIHRGSLAPVIKDATDQVTRNQKIYYGTTLDTKKYFFIRYAYRNEQYTAIWDKKTSTLIANIKADLNDENEKNVSSNWNFVKYRMPNGKKILINISYYLDGKLYAALDAEQAMEFFPDIVSDDNPVLMIINIG